MEEKGGESCRFWRIPNIYYYMGNNLHKIAKCSPPFPSVCKLDASCRILLAVKALAVEIEDTRESFKGLLDCVPLLKQPPIPLRGRQQTRRKKKRNKRKVLRRKSYSRNWQNNREGRSIPRLLDTCHGEGGSGIGVGERRILW